MSLPVKSKTSASGHLQVPGSNDSVHRVQNVPGYRTPVFKEKDEQRAKVQANVIQKVRNYLTDVPPPFPMSACCAFFCIGRPAIVQAVCAAL